MKPYIIVTIVMLLSFTCLMGCFSTTFLSNTGHEWTQVELDSYWDGFNDVWALDQNLKDRGYKYGNEPNDINMWADTPPTSIVTMSRGWANCTGWTQYFNDFIKYKKAKNIRIVDSFKVYFLKNDLKWHRFILFQIGEVRQVITDLEILPFNSEQEILDYWYNKGYAYQKVEETFYFGL